MDADKLHEIMKKIVILLTVIWGLFLFPGILLIVFLSQGVVGFPTENLAAQQVLYYNIIVFPVLIIVSIMLSWLCLYYKKYWEAIGLALLPLATFLIEIVAADIALYLL